MRTIVRLVTLLLCVSAGCASDPGPQTTRLATDDITDTINQISGQLAGSDFLADRTTASPPITITTTKLQNLSLDQIREGEMWMFAQKVQAGLNSTPLARMKNIAFQIPPEQVARLRQQFPEVATGSAPPTHVMTAAVRSSRRTASNKEGFEKARSDLYFFEYNILQLNTGKTEWTGTVEFKKAAVGIAID